MLGWKGNDFPKEKARHLYLVFDDWSWGYSIRKIDLLAGDGDCEGSRPSSSSMSDVDYNLPPPIFRFQAPRGHPNYFAGAFDSKILAMHPMDPQFSLNPNAGVPIFDVRKRCLMVGPRQRPDLLHPIYVPVGGRLFSLAAGSFQLLYPPPDANSYSEGFVWTWQTLPDPPFDHKQVTSYAVHRDGRTMFVSTRDSPAIFSFDTAESARNACMWKQHAQCQLPFNGRGYFVAELGALDVKFCNVNISIPDLLLGTTLNGGLTTGDSCRCRSYINFPGNVSELMHENPVAFWM
nr:unnamed protein product [Digitaria exilis]